MANDVDKVKPGEWTREMALAALRLAAAQPHGACRVEVAKAFIAAGVDDANAKRVADAYMRAPRDGDPAFRVRNTSGVWLAELDAMVAVLNAPAAPPDYPALHARVSALLKENDRLKRRVAEVERERDQCLESVGSYTTRLSELRMRLDAALARPLPGFDERRFELTKAALAGGRDAYGAVKLADEALAELDVPPGFKRYEPPANGQAALDGSAARPAPACVSPDGSDDLDDEEVERILACPRDEWCGDQRTIGLAAEVKRRREAARAPADDFELIANEIERGVMKPATIALLARQSAKRLRGGR